MPTQTSRLDDPVSFPKDDSEWHSFLDGHVETALEIRNHVENLPKTRATFTLHELDLKLSNIPDGVVKLTGAWRAPDLILSGARQKWVNPNYVHAQHYSDVVVRCGCGIPVLRQQFSEGEKQPAHHQEHNENCTKIMRKKTELELLKNRRDIVIDAYQHGHTATGISNRLGYPDGHHIGTGETQEWGINIRELNRESRRKIARSIMVLCREYSPVKIGPIFGMTRKSASEILTKETKSDASTLYGVRRRA